MSFTSNIKKEIVTIKYSHTESIATISAYLRNNSSFNQNKIAMTSENKQTIDFIMDYFISQYKISPIIKIVENVNFSKKRLYKIIINEKVSNILEDLGINKNNLYLETVPEYIVGSNAEIRAYLRGVFLSIGSVNDPKTSRYHMELLVNKAKEAVFIQKILNIFELNAKILNRDKGYMIYLKEAEKISDFLKILGVNNAVMYYEDVRVYRDQKNRTNRLNNCEQANIDKVIQSATSQLKDIELIEKNDGLMLLDEKIIEVINYRKKYPEASLKELSEIISLELNKTITKSGLNHRMKKIKELANKFRKMDTIRE